MAFGPNRQIILNFDLPDAQLSGQINVVRKFSDDDRKYDFYAKGMSGTAVFAVEPAGQIAGLDLPVGMESAVRDGALRTLPGVHGCDGFFAVVLERVTG